MERSARINELTSEVSALQAQVDKLTEFIGLLKRFEPQKYAEVRRAQEVSAFDEISEENYGAFGELSAGANRRSAADWE